ncbi:alpha-L-arabinofuranosidase B-like protein [Streptomyces sp. TLI_55]|uniref:AbfB domain-containing protein n=1 Tax=Streptomyces sp. TLI_55 TaxID=1938861 RepID=UPI000BC84F15|nr:AbfB domain-containing protein [Streptomyces sp. TLI_55]SNX61882.1 alpha-L-arabinofuranosidase B-like protein [Streptomyces sp. TLI_55]
MPVFQFQSFNFPDHYVRHKDFVGLLTKHTDGEQGDFSFEVKNAGQDKHGVQLVVLRSVNFPDHYLRHQNFQIVLQAPNGGLDDLFLKDATFYLERGLADGGDPEVVSFRSVNYPDRYLRHRDFKLWLEPKDSPNLPADATFRKTVPVD